MIFVTLFSSIALLSMQVANPYIEYRNDRWHGKHLGEDSSRAISTIKNVMKTIAPCKDLQFSDYLFDL